MKLLLDQNISFRVTKMLADIFPGIAQVRELGLENSRDIEIWQFAREQQYVIVTFDADFYDISLLRGIPPKIIWLRTGNLTSKNIEKLLRENAPIIQDFITNSDFQSLACLEIL